MSFLRALIFIYAVSPILKLSKAYKELNDETYIIKYGTFSSDSRFYSRNSRFCENIGKHKY